MGHLHAPLMRIAEVIDLIGLAIVLIGAIKFLAMYGLIEARRALGRKCVLAMQRARLVLGGYILIALEFMICSDIINSALVRTLDSLVYLAGIVVLRTAIGFFLDRDLRADESTQLQPQPNS